MDEIIIDILNALRLNETLSASDLDKMIRRRSKEAHDGRRLFAKKRILPYYLEIKKNDAHRFASWNVSDELDARFIRTMKMKPRRTASGVATITVITKPWPCAGNCIYCPCDIRMPKSYLHDEPACQRAERNYFDPYLQVASRLGALQRMGHVTDKVELIVLGGSWSDYPEEYRIWFIHELFRALNDDDEARTREARTRSSLLQNIGLESDPDALELSCKGCQDAIDAGRLAFNEAFDELYTRSAAWRSASELQHATWSELEHQHALNEAGAHRVVGLVVETRPDALVVKQLKSLRRLGCTKIQMGIQSLDASTLKANGRNPETHDIARAFEACRLFGFKSHAHFMANLLGSTPESDKADFQALVTHPSFLPDEIKLYPCALVASTKLMDRYRSGEWRPYTEEELIDVLCADMRITPPYTRVSRMIRDISASDIVAGNKKTNLRQLVDTALADQGAPIEEIRFREIGSSEVNLDELDLDDVCYDTSVSTEHFLQWITPERKIVGFLRLSLPDVQVVNAWGDSLPVNLNEAMIREVHVYGFAARLERDGGTAQHRGLGKKLIEHACTLAKDAGYKRIHVISAVGTRQYYRRLGFVDDGLYQTKPL